MPREETGEEQESASETLTYPPAIMEKKNTFKDLVTKSNMLFVEFKYISFSITQV